MKKELSELEKGTLKSAIQVIDEIVAAGNKALNKFPTNHYDLELFMFINFLDRFTTHLFSINILLRYYEKNPGLETSIGLIARAGILDFMTITYLSSFQVDIGSPADPKGEIYRKEVDKIMCDQVNFTFKFIKEAKNTGLITEQEYNTVIESSYQNYSFLFTDQDVNYQNPESKLIARKTISPNQLFKRIHAHPLTSRFSMIYDLYTYYSKYEHYGIMTHFMQRQGVDIDLERIFGAIQYLIKGMAATFRYLSVPQNLLQIEMKLVDELEEKFLKIINLTP